ncbi:MAG: IS701 family transposase [Microcystaceae cyanobacterium]
MSFSCLDYCQYLLSSQTNYTITNLSNHLEEFSHDIINRYLRSEKLTPKIVFENIKKALQINPQASLIFDDTVSDKRFSQKIELVRRQYSGNEHRVIRGIGIVSCVYVNPETGEFWVIDYRIYDPDGDRKTKLDHVADMLRNVVYQKQLPFRQVLMDSWYGAQDIMALIDNLGKIYYVPLKKNRLVDDTSGVEKYQQIEQLIWRELEQEKGKLIKINKFPKAKKVKLFRVTVSANRTEYIATNDLTQSSTESVKKECSLRWKIEEFHRDVKQLTGLEACQCRSARIQRNHIACAILVWNQLKKLASLTAKTVYQLKSELLGEYLKKELKYPSLKMKLI